MLPVSICPGNKHSRNPRDGSIEFIEDLGDGQDDVTLSVATKVLDIAHGSGTGPSNHSAEQEIREDPERKAKTLDKGASLRRNQRAEEPYERHMNFRENERPPIADRSSTGEHLDFANQKESAKASTTPFSKHGPPTLETLAFKRSNPFKHLMEVLIECMFKNPHRENSAKPSTSGNINSQDRSETPYPSLFVDENAFIYDENTILVGRINLLTLMWYTLGKDGKIFDGEGHHVGRCEFEPYYTPEHPALSNKEDFLLIDDEANIYDEYGNYAPCGHLIGLDLYGCEIDEDGDIIDENNVLVGSCYFLST